VSNLNQQQWNPAANQLSWDDLRIIKALVECKSRAAAADRLGLNVSTVTRRIAQLEEDLGITLFRRRRSNYILTAEGLELHALSERVEADVVGVVRRISGSMQGAMGTLRITVSDSLLFYLLTPIIAAYKARYKSASVEVFFSNSHLNLARDESDIAFRATQAPPENLVGRKLATIAWAPYGRIVDFPHKVPDIDTLYGEAWVSYSLHMSRLKAFEYVERKVPPGNIQYRANSVAGVHVAIEAGIGLGFLPCFQGDNTPGLMRVGPVVPEIEDALWILTHPDIRKSQRIKAFMSFCTAELAKNHKPLIEGQRPALGR
jgi:DNA-binding transcriptional LysR family regulator